MDKCEKEGTVKLYRVNYQLTGTMVFEQLPTHFIEIQQPRLLYHNVAYTKQQLSSNNQVSKINSVRAAANIMQGPINSRFEQNHPFRNIAFYYQKTMPNFFKFMYNIPVFISYQ